MKNFAYLILVVFMMYPNAIKAEDARQTFMGFCTEHKSAVYCTCTLDNMSQGNYDYDKHEIVLKSRHHEASTQNLLSDPALTLDKINTVCDLHDKAMNHDKIPWEPPSTERAKKLNLLVREKAVLLEEKGALVLSYNASKSANSNLISGSYCTSRMLVRSMKEDIAEWESSNDIVYGKVRREIKHRRKRYVIGAISNGISFECSE